ncbi:MAG: sigma-54 dependent transcriptional regulator [Pyrinomonadaceae bacterium]
MSKESILIVEDEELMRSILRQLLADAGYDVFSADSSETALEIYSTNDILIALTDIKMSGKDGLELLDQIKTIDPDAIVIIITAFSSVDTAIAALRKGAYDYVSKPFVNEDLLQTVANAVAHRRLFQENRFLRREINRQFNFSEIIGNSAPLQRVFDLVNKVADTSANVLIQGESGTGKELIARSIHFNSNRSDKPFLPINCGALPESLLESELFGHVKGAFTGAVSDKKGLFRSTAGGTLFLDEVGEMPASLQVKLLRALQEREITPVGSAIPIRFDARLIAATNKDLETEVEAGNFREDLFYRLHVIEIEVPPLRDRREDIPILARHFAEKTAQAQNGERKPISSSAMSALQQYGWPGNVRELENVIERSVILSGDEIDVESLPPKVRKDFSSISNAAAGLDSRPTLDEMERHYIMETLLDCGEDKVKAASILGIDLSTLYRKLKRYGLN